MYLHYFYDPKLAQASYLVGCQETGEAIVIDPARTITPYLEVAQAQGFRIVAAAETHIHADFVSGARELAERAEAKLYLSGEGGEQWSYPYQAQYAHQNLKDGDTFKIGNLVFEVWYTPGHTPEHISFLLTDAIKADTPMGMFTGDFVFVGSVGRPDLLESAVGQSGTAEPLARQMYQSLQRFKTLPDFLQVWPGHGAGSSCGKGLGAVPSSTVGYEKRFNWALQADDETAFVRELLAGQPETPTYFARMKRINQSGPPIIGPAPTLPIISQPERKLRTLRGEGTPIIDTRPAAHFAVGHLAGTLNIPNNDAFITWLGWLASYDRPVYLIGDAHRADDILRDLLSIGLDNAAGLFDSSVIEQVEQAGAMLESYPVATPTAIADEVAAGEVTVLDVRAQSEWKEGHIPDAHHIMLGQLPRRLDEIPTDKPILVQCRSGARSAIGASLLQQHGIKNVMNLAGGIRAWEKAGLPTS